MTSQKGQGLGAGLVPLEPGSVPTRLVGIQLGSGEQGDYGGDCCSPGKAGTFLSQYFCVCCAIAPRWNANCSFSHP